MTPAVTQLLEQYHRLTPDERSQLRDVLLNPHEDGGDLTEEETISMAGQLMAEIDRQDEEWTRKNAAQAR